MGAAGYTLTFSNGSTGSFTSILLAPSFAGAFPAAHTLNVLSGASVSATSLTISATQLSKPGIVKIAGSNSALTLSGMAPVTIGAASGAVGSGLLSLQDGGTLSGGLDLTTVNATGTVAISGGVYILHGDLLLNGGILTRDRGGVFALDAGRTFTIQEGGKATFNGSYISSSGSTLIVAGSTSSFTATGELEIGHGATTTFRNGSIGIFGDILVGVADAADSFGVLDIQSGASASATNVSVAVQDGAPTTGSITIIGPGSRVSCTTLEVGASSGGSGSVTVESGATLSTSFATVVNATGSLNAKPGSTLTGAADFSGAGPINWPAPTYRARPQAPVKPPALVSNKT